MISPQKEFRFGPKTIKIPQSPFARKVLGVLLILGGILGFLPILGFWMLPLGLLILSIDLPFLRKYRRKIAIKMEKRKRSQLLPAPQKTQEHDLA
ncbi:hypothetical protein SAMN04488056_108149 [Cohaesibacter marisflavi]|uniref:Transmembrane protein (PGPGW) n=1 Tax=Cohaesibacter marisflavi TaxID=655353 RepID=A0A1I5IA71_9HYPH|nr:hypothetical protein [Cohaesibacter marisflavi]SFO57497.1 hypothetical protein SAMN04488056_108149 [Cohaesibacter marisflavi]